MDCINLHIWKLMMLSRSLTTLTLITSPTAFPANALAKLESNEYRLLNVLSSFGLTNLLIRFNLSCKEIRKKII